ncbi:MAG: carboxypeptidase regulatory-like domain-containing protein [Chloroflexia bacterium]
MSNSNLIMKASKVIKVLGVFGIMLSLAGALAVAPSASAATLTTGTAGGNSIGAYAPQPDGKLGVYAIDTVKGAAIPGAQVVVINQAGQSVAKGLTNANGFFSTSLPAGTYKVAIFAKGYKQQSEAVEAKAGETTITKIGVEPVNTPAPAFPPALS